MDNRTSWLIDTLKKIKEKSSVDPELTQALDYVKNIKIDEKEIFINRLTRAVILMVAGVDHKNIEFAKYKFYDRVDNFCRQAVRVAAIVKQHHA